MIWNTNLAILRAKVPSLARRLCTTVPDAHLGTAADGALTWRNHNQALRLSLHEHAVTTCTEQATRVQTPLLFGIGAGEVLEQLLADGGVVHAYERDPALLRRWLTRHDVSSALQTGRLVLWLGADLNRLDPATVTVVPHPVLGQPYRWEREAWMNRGLRRAMLATGGLMVNDIRRALQDEGWSVWPLDNGRLAPAELEHTLATWSPELVVSVNHVRGLSSACRRHDARLWVWEIDPSLEAIRPEAGSHHHTLLSTWRSQQVDQWRRAGFSRAEYLPLAAASHRRPKLLDHEDLVRFDAPVAFVGASLVANAHRCRRIAQEALTGFTGDPGRARQLLETVLAGQRQDFSRFLVPTLLQEHAPGFNAWMQTRSAADPAQLIGELSACEKRLNAVAALGGLGVHVWGDAGWQQLASHGVQVRGPVGHQKELTRLYNAAPLQLDVGRLYQQDIVTLRVFDAAACGACVLTEPSSALAELFEPGEEVVVWRSFEELRALTAALIADPERAAAIGQRARDRVERDHRLRDRVVHALQTLALATPPEQQHSQRRQRVLTDLLPET